MNLRSPLVILMLAAAAALSFWMGYTPEEEAAVAIERTGPDLFMDRFTTLVTDETGQPEYRFSGERMERLRPDGHSEVTAPSVVFEDNSGALPWTLVADRAWISPDNDEVQLIDHVVIDRPAQRGLAASRLTTPYLTVLPKARIAETGAQVELRRGPHRLDAVGMHADLQARTVDFKSEVRTVYVR